jgi:hypothetical protein
MSARQAGVGMLRLAGAAPPAPPSGVVTSVTVAAVGGFGSLSYSGTYLPGDVSPAPGVFIEVLNGGTVVASEAADSVAAGAFSGSIGGLTAGSRTVRATADGGATATSDAVTVTTDTTPPQIQSRNLPSPATLVIGQTVNIELVWSEPVQVTGAPFLPGVLDSGNIAIAYVSGSGTNTTLWQYPIASGDAEAVGVQLSGGITLNGGTIRDAAGNDADLTTNNGATTITGLLVNGSGGFSSPGGVSSWALAFDARNPAAWPGGVLPADLASVTTTNALYSATYALAQDGAEPVPVFKTDALGTGRHALRWGASANAHLLAAGMAEALWNGDMAGVMWVVLRAPSATAATQFLAGFCHPTGTANAANNNLSIILTTASILGRYTGTNTTGDVTISGAIPVGENLLLRLRRLNSTDTTPLSIFRDSATDAGPVSGGNATAPTPAAASAMRFIVGRRLWNNTTSIPVTNVDIGAIYYLPGEPSAGTISAVEADLKSAWGIT